MKAEYQTILDNMPTRSAWARGVKDYAADLLQDLDENEPTRANLLNGASDWREWAMGGCGLCYDDNIAERLCSPSELKRNRNGSLPPNSRDETWIDVETRAVSQAAARILRAVKAA